MEAKRNVIFNKVGGNASANAVGYKISIPAGMIESLGITRDDRTVTLKCEDGKIIIEKAHQLG